MTASGQTRETSACRPWLLVLFTGALVSCDPGAAPSSDVASDPVPRESSTAVEDETQVDSKTIATGEIRIGVENERFHIVANEAKRERALGALAAVAGGSIEVDVLEPGIVSGEWRDVTLPQALSLLAGQIPYSLHYQPEGSAAHHLVRIRVGEDAPEALAAPSAPGDAPQHAQFRAPPPLADDADGEKIGRWQETHPGLYARLFDPDEAARIATVELIEVDEDGAVQLHWLLRNEPSARVRSAIVQHLDDDDSDRARRLVRYALDDPDPGVVGDALDVIEAWDDAAMVQEVAPLRDHWDGGVRTRVEAFLQRAQGRD